MGGAWSTHGRKYKSMHNLCRKNMKQKDNLKDLGLDGRKILKGTLKRIAVCGLDVYGSRQ
jgi:hypothetical protein